MLATATYLWKFGYGMNQWSGAPFPATTSATFTFGQESAGFGIFLNDFLRIWRLRYFSLFRQTFWSCRFQLESWPRPQFGHWRQHVFVFPAHFCKGEVAWHQLRNIAILLYLTYATFLKSFSERKTVKHADLLETWVFVLEIWFFFLKIWLFLAVICLFLFFSLISMERLRDFIFRKLRSYFT